MAAHGAADTLHVHQIAKMHSGASGIVTRVREVRALRATSKNTKSLRMDVPFTARQRSRIRGARQQNTGTQHASIFYPLHPLVGRRLRIRERRPGPPPTYYLVTETGEGFAVPVWMTVKSAGDLRHEERPWIHVRALLQIAGVTRKQLESVDLQEEILPSDQAKEIPHVDQSTPVDIDTGAAPSRTASAARNTRRERRAHRADAASSCASRKRVQRRKGAPR